MLPSLLAREIEAGLKNFLVTGYEPSDSFFGGVMHQFVENENGWFKGPYVQIGLPYRPGPSGRDYFEHLVTAKPSYVHQEAAWARLHRERPQSTLVATGTGSGKTECFLYPLLGHAARARSAGEGGIKALVIYPMNALANDQARRFAETIATTPFLTGLRVGLFVGGRQHDAGAGMVMTPDAVITDRDTLRKTPPDVLLTNYKMLDYLLIRPRDRALWKQNGPTTLRYVVVDELHTFDGAQGTDLALLLRRLRARLKTPPGHFVYVGTSATLGSQADTTGLRDYARQVFDTEFPTDSVIRESRLTPSEFLEEQPIEHVLQWRAELPALFEPGQHASIEAAVTAWFVALFPDLPAPTNVNDLAWREALGHALKRHLLFVNLLRLLKDGLVSLPDLYEQMQSPLPAAARAHIGPVLDALLVLVAWARGEKAADRAFVSLRLQLWLRELRRMVARLAAIPADVSLRAGADLKSALDGLYLPLIQCSECRATAWLSRLPPGSPKLSTKLDEIYGAWFGGAPDVVRLYPGLGSLKPLVEGVPSHACTACGNLQAAAGRCVACRSEDLVAVFRTTGTRTTTRGNAAYTWHDATCAGCGSADRMLLIGARNATLAAQVVEQSWASPFNDDKKLIAFSDSVQDAAHRAGFFAARTYMNTVRTGIGKAINQLARSSMPWPEFLERFGDIWLEVDSPLRMSPEQFVAEFIGPNMTWQRDWVEGVLERDRLPDSSRLPGRVQKRLRWQTFAELTYLSQRGRNLDRIGFITLAPKVEAVESASQVVGVALGEGLGVRDLEAGSVFQWLWGLLTHLKQRGAVTHPELMLYLEDANLFGMLRTAGRREWLPPMSVQAPHPVYLTLGTHRQFDRIVNTRRSTWYQRWLTVALGRGVLLPQGIESAAYEIAINALVANGVLKRVASRFGDAVGIEAAALNVRTDVVRLTGERGSQRLTVPADVADRLMGMPCVDAMAEHYTSADSERHWLAERFTSGDLRRVIAAEHTGLLEREEREKLEQRFKASEPAPWHENLLSATPTLEMGVDIGDLSSVMLCSVPPSAASYLQRVGRAGRRDGNAFATTLADGNSPHDLYFFEETEEMMAGEVVPPGVFLKAAEVLKRQLTAFCFDDWVASGISVRALPDKTADAVNAVENADTTRFPYTFLDYVLVQSPRLFEEFVALLGRDIDQSVRDRLSAYYDGTGDDDSMRLRLLKVFEDLANERSGYRKRVQLLKNRIDAVRKKPQDEATAMELDQLRREREGMLSLITEINQRDLLNTLTDAGLLPNYAFPEAGIELKSVLWRNRGSDDRGDSNYIALPAIKYERPAASALSEFAPENRFYANQRRVEVDQVNMQLAKIEQWRLCPSCHHMQNLEISADSFPVCPRCGDPMWANVSQSRQLLRFRQAIANSNDERVRIDDSAEDREPRFYTRQLLVDFERNDVKEAWRVAATETRFGFEFIARASFRDVNFGEPGKPGETFKVADQESPRPGFKLCRSCGKVQRPPRRESDPDEQLHAFDCEARGSDDPNAIVECLYLYREFASEALRILVPYTKSGVDEEVIQSFIAALQLGLKRRFAGKVDHLRVVTQDEPGRDGGPRRHYVLVYDSVPGGTGYLHQLLAQDAQTMREVLTLARQTMVDCACHQDPDKDGCYRCLYQYRLGRAMDKVSRDRAIEVLTELLVAMEHMERVPTISDIFINPHFDSALEARFVEGLRRLGGKHQLPPVQLVQDIVRGKSGYVMEVGSTKYLIEPQVDVGADDGVAVASRPDFVIWPAASSAKRKAIAVFCDGWEFHKDRMRDDAQKRSALVAGGEFWVLSVSHADVESAIAGEAHTELESPLTLLGWHDGSQAPPQLLRPEVGAFQDHALSFLLRWLGTADGDDEAFVQARARDWIWATYLTIPGPARVAESEFVGREVARMWTTLPLWAQSQKEERTPAAASREHSFPVVRLYWPRAFLNGDVRKTITPGVLSMDDVTEIQDAPQHMRWRQWIRMFNWAQFIPGMLLTTRSGLDGHDYESLEPKLRVIDRRADAMPDMWRAVIEQAMSVLSADLEQLVLAGIEPPDEVGFEVDDAQGNVEAEAELAWTAERLVVLLPHQMEWRSRWERDGWVVAIFEDGWRDNVIAHVSKTTGE